MDVKHECLAKMEEEMFECSQVAGTAGEYQWGLDAGDHQDAWNPYDGLPDHWIHTDTSAKVHVALLVFLYFFDALH